MNEIKTITVDAEALWNVLNVLGIYRLACDPEQEEVRMIEESADDTINPVIAGWDAELAEILK